MTAYAVYYVMSQVYAELDDPCTTLPRSVLCMRLTVAVILQGGCRQ